MSERERADFRKVTTPSKYIWELIGAGVLIGLTFIMEFRGNINEQTTWIIGAITATIAASSVLLKMFFTEVAEDLARRHRNADSKAGEIGHILETLSGEAFQYADRTVDEAVEALKQIEKGVIPLDEAAYYDELLSAVRHCPNHGSIYAVSSINIARWTENIRQHAYLSVNYEAAKRGVTIHRIFLMEKRELNTANVDLIRKTICEQASRRNFQIRIGWMEDIKGNKNLHEDFVIIEHSPPVLFLDQADPHDTTRVLTGHKVINAEQIGRYRGYFDTLRSNYSEDYKSTPQFSGAHGC